MALENQQTTADSLADSSKAGLQAATNAAKTVKRLKNASHTASSVATAAVKVKSAKYIAIAIAVAIFALILVCAFYAGPMAIFERLQGFSDKIKEVYESEYYSSDINNNWQKLISSVKAFLKGISEAISELWSLVSTRTENEDGFLDDDFADDNDLLVMGERDALRDEYQKKVDAVKSKYDTRSQKLKESVEAVKGELSGWVGAVDFPRDRQSFLSEEYSYESQWNNLHTVYRDGVVLHEGYSTPEDMFVVEYGGLNLAWSISKMTSNQAVDLIALCTTQFDNSVEHIKPSQLMKWMGYYDGNGEGPQISDIGQTGIASPPLPHYTGLFMPQYLIDEKVLNPDSDYSSYMAPAVDALIEFRAPSFANLSPHIEDVEADVLVNYTHPEQYISGYQIKYKNEKYKDNGVTHWRRVPYNDYNNPIYSWHDVTYSTYQVKKIKVITYTANCSIMCRSVSILSDLADFYDGEAELEKDLLDATPSPGTEPIDELQEVA